VYNYDECMALSMNQDKLEILDIVGDYCCWCKKLYEATFSDEEVRPMQGRRAFIKINVDEEPDVADTCYIPLGKMVFDHACYTNSRDLL